jgi:hypothetical protein
MRTLFLDPRRIRYTPRKPRPASGAHPARADSRMDRGRPPRRSREAHPLHSRPIGRLVANPKIGQLRGALRHLCVPRIPSTALTSRVAFPAA